MSVRVRPARPEDQAPLLALWHEVDELHGRIAPGFFAAGERARAFHPPELSARALLQSAASRTELLLVAEDARGRVLGAVSGGLRDTPRSPSMRPCRRLHVETLVVSTAARRRGVGRRLMAAAETWGRRHDAEQVVLTVWTGNDEAAGFYRAMGYDPVSQVLAHDL